MPDPVPSNDHIAELPQIVAQVVQNERTGWSANMLDPFHDRGWTYLGRGEDGHGYVLRSPDGVYVARIGNDPVASMATAMLAEQNRGNPWFPDVAYHGPMECSDLSRYVTVTPFLSHDTSGQTEQIANLLGGYSPGARAITPEMRAQLLADPHFVSASRQIFVAADGLSRRFADVYPGFDANPQNIMLRPDGQAVITDPFRSNDQFNPYPIGPNSAINKTRSVLGLPALQPPDESARTWTLNPHDPNELQSFVKQVVTDAHAAGAPETSGVIGALTEARGALGKGLKFLAPVVIAGTTYAAMQQANAAVADGSITPDQARGSVEAAAKGAMTDAVLPIPTGAGPNAQRDALLAMNLPPEVRARLQVGHPDSQTGRVRDNLPARSEPNMSDGMKELIALNAQIKNYELQEAADPGLRTKVTDLERKFYDQFDLMRGDARFRSELTKATGVPIDPSEPSYVAPPGDVARSPEATVASGTSSLTPQHRAESRPPGWTATPSIEVAQSSPAQSSRKPTHVGPQLQN